jgi:hypothetical protein
VVLKEGHDVNSVTVNDDANGERWYVNMECVGVLRLATARTLVLVHVASSP